MKHTGKPESPEPGRYLMPRTQPPARKRSGGVRRVWRWMTVTVLLCWDGLLLYMIINCLIVPVFGGLFIALVSVYLGYQLKQEE